MYYQCIVNKLDEFVGFSRGKSAFDLTFTTNKIISENKGYKRLGNSFKTNDGWSRYSSIIGTLRGKTVYDKSED
jgi:hypothetical protein